MIVLMLTSSGQGVVGKVQDNQLSEFLQGVADRLRVESPLEVHITPPQSATGQAQLAMVPFGFPSRQVNPRIASHLEFYKHTLSVAPEEAPEPLRNAWIGMTSGLEVPAIQTAR